MPTLFLTNPRRITTAVLLLAVAACGGGGMDSTPTKSASSESASAAAANPPSTTAAVLSSIVTSVSPTTYDPASEKGKAYAYLNAQRQLCGFGLLQQDARIDVAAQAHADYHVINNLTPGHFESKEQFPNGYTGDLPWDRMGVAGYVPTFSGENVMTENQTYSKSYGEASIMDYFLAPYHGTGLLDSYRDVGIGFVKTNSRLPSYVSVMDFGTIAGRPAQLLDETTVVTYPCNGVTGVLSRSYKREDPTPIEGRDLSVTPIGHPIYLKARDGQILSIVTADLRAFGTNVSLPLIPKSKANDTTGPIHDGSMVVLMPDSPLEKNTSYLFKATVLNNGKQQDVSFTFSTGTY